MAALDLNDTVARLLRGAIHMASPGRVAGIRAAAPTSRIAAAAAAKTEREAKPRHPPAAATPAIDDSPAVTFTFHAADAATIVRAMIAAAMADGEIDAGENRRILGWLHDAGGTPADFAFVRQQMARRTDAESIARGVTRYETAVEIYAAALLVTEAATAGSRDFLRRLAAALALDRKFVAALHAAWDDPPP